MDLIEELAQFSLDPYGFVLFAFPWGEPGQLAQTAGPDEWQRELLESIGFRLQAGELGVHEAILEAVASGHGVGKSALVSWVILWAISTHEDTKGVVTANTENQLKTKTWVEVAKWHRLFIGKDYFKLTATALFSNDPEHERTWRIDMVPWSERNTEAFAGMHNEGKRILVIFDEGSAIPDTIWEVTEGALTDHNTQIIWLACGNPTRNKGRFRECFDGGKFAHRWTTRTVDSRTVRITNKELFKRWVEDYGEDSDFVRVRVRGMFPRIDAESFISYDLARQAVNREIEPQLGHRVVLGVDVARFGDDASVIYPRQGRDGLSRPPEVYFGIDTMALVAKVVQAYHRHNAIQIFVDEGGLGAGVVDRLRQLQLPVIGVDFGSSADGISDQADRGDKYANKRAEIWGAMRAWLAGGSIPDRIEGLEVGLVDELTAPNYGLNAREAIQLESKKDMRRRGVASPNIADALACTFAFPLLQPSVNFEEAEKPVVHDDYNPFDHERIFA